METIVLFLVSDYSYVCVEYRVKDTMMRLSLTITCIDCITLYFSILIVSIFVFVVWLLPCCVGISFGTKSK